MNGILGRQKILIVDDRKENLFALQKALQGLDAEVIEAQNGNNALAATLDHHFALAILDVVMPGMSGYELAEYLRGDEKTKFIPIIFVTASLQDEAVQFQGYESGGIDFIFKPFNPEALKAKVRNFLELDRHRQELRLHRDHLESLVTERTSMLAERVNEVRCLYAISGLVAHHHGVVDEQIANIVNIIPSAWPKKGMVRTRISVDDRLFVSNPFSETPHRQSADITVNGSSIGRLDVFYVDTGSEADRIRYLEDKRELIWDIGRKIGMLIERDRSAAQELHLKTVLKSIRHVNQVIVMEKQRDRLIQTACDILTISRGFQGAWIILTDGGPGRVEGAHSGFNGEIFSLLLQSVEKGEMPNCCVLDSEDSETIVQAFQSDRCGECPMAHSFHNDDALIVRLRHEGIVFGYLCVVLPRQYAANEEEISLLEEIGGDIAFALHGIVRDKETRKMDNMIQAIFHKAKDGILLFDSDARRIVTANNAMYELLGYDPGEIQGMSIKKIHPEEAWPVIDRELNRQLMGESAVMIDLPLLCKDGRVIPTDVKGAALELDGLTHHLAVFRDVTDRMADKQRIDHLNRLLRAIREVNQMIIYGRDPEILVQQTCKLLVDYRGYLSTLIILTDEDDKPKYWSHSGLKFNADQLDMMLNKPAIPVCCQNAGNTGKLIRLQEENDDCEGCPLCGPSEGDERFCVRLSHEERTYGYLLATLEKGLSADPEEHRLFTETADDLAFALYSREMKKTNEEAENERKLLESQLRQAQKMESVGRLAGGVAHDFNNILTVIMGNAELVLARLEESDSNYDKVEEILKAGERSADLTRQLLAFARKQTIRPMVLDLNQIVSGLLKMLGRLLGEEIDIFWKSFQDLWSVKMDPSQIDQILANLCVNARDAITGVGKVTIETENVTFDWAYCQKHAGFFPGEYVLLAVSDNGSGMDKETLDRAFEPFFTTKTEGKGTGLGLATVFGIVKQNHGFVNVYSEIDRGTTFKIYLPRYTGQPVTNPVSTIFDFNRGQGETILLVEDDESLLEVSLTMLETMGYHILSAPSPLKAIEISDHYSEEIDLLITDVIMPDMNGRELSNRLKAARPRLKTLFMSGYTANVIAHHGVLEEDVAFVQKPFSINQFSKKIRESLN